MSGFGVVRPGEELTATVRPVVFQVRFIMANAQKMRNRAKLGRRFSRSGSGGMTLIEISISVGILSLVLASSLSAAISTHNRNRLIATEIAARNAMRKQIEEVMSVATDYAFTVHNGEAALGTLAFYARDPYAAEEIVGPGGEPMVRTYMEDGRMISLFSVPEPGSPSRALPGGSEEGSKSDRKAKEYRGGYGRIIMYLDETDVPPAPNTDMMWEDLGDNDNWLEDGFDMNGDGKIEHPTIPITQNTLRNSLIGVDIKRLPIDVEVHYFNNEKQSQEIYSITRRMIVSNSYNLSSLLEGNGIEN